MPDTKRRLRPSPSLVISIFALVISMSAGAYAAVVAPKNSVLSSSIKNQNVKTADIKNGAVTKKKLAASLKTDLNDAQTVGGMTVQQIVEAAGGEYVEGKQGAGSINILVNTASSPTVATLELPHAGKWLINAYIPIICTWNGDGSPDPEPDEAGLNQPFFMSTATMTVGAATTTDSMSCEAEASGLAGIVPIVQGYRTFHFTRTFTATGPTTVTLKAGRANLINPDEKVTAIAVDSIIQAVTIR